MPILGEIKRRKVFQVAVAYAVVAWLVIQIVDVVNDPLSLPTWFDTLVIVLFAVGFPIAVILAWAFDVTPQGIRAAADAQAVDVAAQPAGQNLNYIMHGLVLLAVGFLLVDQYLLEPQVDNPEGASAIVAGPVTKTVINLPVDAPLALGAEVPSLGFDNPAIAISPDGTLLVYVGKTETGTMLYLREMAKDDVRALSDTDGAIQPFFSPDGAWIGFLTNDRVKKVSIQTGAVLTLADANMPVQGWWTDSDVIYFSEEQGGILSRVPADGSAGSSRVSDQPLVDILGTRLDAKYSDVLPGGDEVLATKWVNSISGDFAEIVMLDIDTLDATTLVPSGYGARYLPSGHVIFARGGSLMAIPFDIERREVTGEAIQVSTNVAMDSLFGQVHADVSDNGLLVFASGGDRSIGKLAWVDRIGDIEYLKDAPTLTYGVVDLAPDGRRLAAHVADVSDYIWIYDFDRRTGRRLSATESYGWPRLRPPDGGEVLFTNIQTHKALLQDIDSGMQPQPVLEDLLDFGPSSLAWANNGESIAFGRFSNFFTIGFVSLGGDVRSTDIKGWLNGFSRDGQFFAYADMATSEIWVASFPDGSTRRLVSDKGIETVWCACGELFYRDGNRWYSTQITTEPELKFDPPRIAFETDFVDTPGISYAVSPDGQRLLVVKRANSDVETTLQVVTNWAQVLRK